MPLFFIPAIFAIDKLAYRLGRLLGSGAAIAAGRGTPSYSRPASTTAWLGRCALSLVMMTSSLVKTPRQAAQCSCRRVLGRRAGDVSRALG